MKELSTNWQALKNLNKSNDRTTCLFQQSDELLAAYASMHASHDSVMIHINCICMYSIIPQTKYVNKVASRY